MVEFRPYDEELRHFRPGDSEYDHTRNQALELGLMLHTATAFNLDSHLPFVPFRYVSELRDTNPPCFLLIYRGDNLETLFSVIMAHARDSQPSPSKAFRLRLAVALARAVFSLHRTGYVHGGLTTDNIFLRPDRDADSVAPLIAGFEVARPKDGHTNKLDVTDRDHILYLHPSRLPGGIAKDSNYPPYDLCGLGVVLLEIGLWAPLRHMTGMRKASDAVRRVKVYKASEQLSRTMGLEYHNMVKYCL